MKVLVIIPTYNEALNIEALISAVFSLQTGHDLHVLVVDDNSPDNTGDIIQNLIRTRWKDRLHMLQRPRKQGLGTAYVKGFKWGLEKDYQVFIEMDADFSHNPAYLPEMLSFLKEYDYIIGSRNIPGGDIRGWGMMRKLISKFGSIYAKLILGVDINDFTGGFNLWKREVLSAIDPDSIRSDGYSFQIELKYKAWKKGFRFKEFPIVFDNRVKGRSKMSKRIVFEAIYRVWQTKFSRSSGHKNIT